MERLTLSDEKRKEGYIVDSRAVQRNGMKFYLKLKEYEDLEEQGMILRLPCKVGDTVFFSTNFDDGMENCIISTVIDSIKINIVDHEEEIVFESLNLYKFKINNFGKTVFLTKEEALNALSEIRNLTN